MSRTKAKKVRMTPKQASRTLQRMQTYVNDLTSTLNKHQPDKDEALASVFVVAVRLARYKGLKGEQFLDEAESAWENLRKLPIDVDEVKLGPDVEVTPSWRGWLSAGVTVSGWAVAAGLVLWTVLR
jgi:hypothetical protein